MFTFTILPKIYIGFQLIRFSISVFVQTRTLFFPEMFQFPIMLIENYKESASLLYLQ